MSASATLDRPRVRDGESRRNPVAKWLFLPLRWVYKVWFATVFFGSLVVLYIPFRILLYTPRRYEKAFRLKRCWAFFLQWASGTPLRLERIAPLPKAPYAITAATWTSSRCTTCCPSTSCSWASMNC
jgi:hypothetical protein